MARLRDTAASKSLHTGTYKLHPPLIVILELDTQQEHTAQQTDDFVAVLTVDRSRQEKTEDYAGLWTLQIEDYMSISTVSLKTL